MSITIEQYYQKVRQLGLKPKTKTVWQTLDESDRFNVPDPTNLPDRVREAILEDLELLVRGHQG
jgi:hypothetical protein